MGFGVWGLGFGVWGLGFRVYIGFGVWGHKASTKSFFREMSQCVVRVLGIKGFQGEGF